MELLSAMVLQCNICIVELNHAMRHMVKMPLLQVTVHQRIFAECWIGCFYATVVVFTQNLLYSEACVFIALVVKFVSLYGMFRVQWCWISPE